jgi:hypothetical protein
MFPPGVMPFRIGGSCYPQTLGQEKTPFECGMPATNVQPLLTTLLSPQGGLLAGSKVVLPYVGKATGVARLRESRTPVNEGN